MNPEATALLIDRCLTTVRPLSQACRALLAEFDREPVDLQAVANHIEHDPVLTLATLRLANSAFYGFVRRIDKVSDAAVLIGVHSLRQVVTSFSIMSACERSDTSPVETDAFWCHSLAVAVTARILAREAQLESEVAFSAGMLQEVGLLVLANGLGADYQPVLDYQAQRCCRLDEAERALLGTDHYAIGAMVLERWHLPITLTAALRSPVTPLVDPPEAALADALQLALALVLGLNISPLYQTPLAPIAPQSLERLGLDWDALEALIPEIDSSCRDVIMALSD